MEEKRYLIHTEILVSGDPMQCIYLSGGHCMAEPIRSSMLDPYKPTEEDQKALCITSDFDECPRFEAFQDHLEKARSK